MEHYNKSIREEYSELKDKILSEIKIKVIEILDGEIYQPIRFENLPVFDNSFSSIGAAKYIYIQNLCLDENHEITVDCLNRDASFSNEFIFGRKIESLFFEDLLKIFDKLNKISNKNEIIRDETIDVKVKNQERNQFVKTLINFKNFVNTQIKLS